MEGEILDYTEGDEVIDHIFTCPRCNVKLVGRSKAYARIKGANHLFKIEGMTTFSRRYLDKHIKEMKE